MRIAYICQIYPPMLSGVSTVMHSLSSGMESCHHSSLVITASDAGAPYIVEKGNIKVVRLRSLVTPKTVNQRFMPFPIRNIASELQAFAPEIVHVHDPYVGGILVKVKKDSQFSWPLVYTVHLQPAAISPHISRAFGVRDYLETKMKDYGTWLVRNCDTVIAPSKHLAKLVNDHTGRELSVISNGIDTRQFNPSPLTQNEISLLVEKYHLLPNIPIILHVGRLSKEKHIEMIIHAAAKAMRVTKTQLVIVGDGAAKESLMRLSRQLAILNRTRFTGFIPRGSDLSAMYRLADIFAFASEVEAQGIVVLEALASGLPVVAVGSSSIPELITNGSNGFLVSPGDVGTMAAKMKSLLQIPDLAAQLGSKGRTVAETHSLNNTICAHERLYESFLRDSFIPMHKARIYSQLYIP